MSLKIALIHISRQRPQIAFDCFNEWLTKCSDSSQIQYILCLDDDDPTLQEYERLFEHDESSNLVLNITESRNGVTALNNGATRIVDTVELLISLSDDTGCFKNWDIELFKLLEGIDNFKEPKFIGVSDGLRGYGAVLVHYIANRAYYDKLKYMLYPEYDGVFADNDMDCIARRLNCVIDAPQLVFQHKHWTLGLSKKDKISEKNDFTTNPNGWRRNEEIFKKRFQRNFDL